MLIACIQSVHIGDNPTYLFKSLESIANQSLSPDLHVIVSDGPLSDVHNNCIENYIINTQHIKIVRLCFKKSKGLAACMNYAIYSHRADFYVRMDSDDISCPNRIETQVKFLLENECIDMVGSWISEIDSLDNIISNVIKYPTSHNDCLNFFKRRNPFVHPSIMFKFSFFEKIPTGYDESFLFDQDRELWSRAFINNCMVANVPSVLLLYRRDSHFFRRRGSFNRSFCRLKNKFRINYKLNFGFFSYLFALFHFIFDFFPPFFKKYTYRFRNFF